jgi:hypothetical protein
MIALLMVFSPPEHGFFRIPGARTFPGEQAEEATEKEKAYERPARHCASLQSYKAGSSINGKNIFRAAMQRRRVTRR